MKVKGEEGKRTPGKTEVIILPVHLTYTYKMNLGTVADFALTKLLLWG